MALHVQGLTGAQRRVLGRSRRIIERRLARPPGPVPRDLRDELRAILSAARPRVDVAYGGDGGGRRTPYASSAGYRILLYERAFAFPPGRETSLAAIFLHEMIHIARGWELDAEAFENAWFSPSEGARRPSADDWTIFRMQDYEGWWVRLDPRSRRVTDYADRHVVTFPRRRVR